MLPNIFEFYHKSEPDFIYTATLEPDGLYMIEWEKERKKDGAVYTANDVDEYVAEGFWVISSK